MRFLKIPLICWATQCFELHTYLSFVEQLSVASASCEVYKHTSHLLSCSEFRAVALASCEVFQYTSRFVDQLKCFELLLQQAVRSTNIPLVYWAAQCFELSPQRAVRWLDQHSAADFLVSLFSRSRVVPSGIWTPGLLTCKNRMLACSFGVLILVLNHSSYQGFLMN